MKFIYDEKDVTTQLTLCEVWTNQFFVFDGYLCQKVSHFKINIIANPEGTPCASTHAVDDPTEMLVSRLLPTVIKIEF